MPVGPFGESPALGLAAEGAEGKRLSPELGFLLVQRLSDLLVTKFHFCQVFFRGGGKTCKWVVLVRGYSWVGWGGSCIADIVSNALMTSVLSFCPEFGMGLD